MSNFLYVENVYVYGITSNNKCILKLQIHWLKKLQIYVLLYSQ